MKSISKYYDGLLQEKNEENQVNSKKLNKIVKTLEQFIPSLYSMVLDKSIPIESFLESYDLQTRALSVINQFKIKALNTETNQNNKLSELNEQIFNQNQIIKKLKNKLKKTKTIINSSLEQDHNVNDNVFQYKIQALEHRISQLNHEKKIQQEEMQRQNQKYNSNLKVKTASIAKEYEQIISDLKKRVNEQKQTIQCLTSKILT